MSWVIPADLKIPITFKHAGISNLAIHSLLTLYIYTISDADPGPCILPTPPPQESKRDIAQLNLMQCFGFPSQWCVYVGGLMLRITSRNRFKQRGKHNSTGFVTRNSPQSFHVSVWLNFKWQPCGIYWGFYNQMPFVIFHCKQLWTRKWPLSLKSAW